MDEALSTLMAAWDDNDKAAAVKIDVSLMKMFTDADKDSNGRMSFSEFEELCAGLRHASFADEQLLDIYDEAIRVTEQLSGEESDSVSPDAFVRVARAHNMLPPQTDAFVDPVAAAMADLEARSSRAVEVQDGPSFQAGPGKGRVKRTVIKGSSSKGAGDDKEKKNEMTEKPEKVHQVIPRRLFQPRTLHTPHPSPLPTR